MPSSSPAPGWRAAWARADGGPLGPVTLMACGLARLYHASKLSGLSLPDTRGGTPGCMPAEQVTDYRGAKPPADQYSAAATLCYLLSKQLLVDRVGGTVG